MFPDDRNVGSFWFKDEKKFKVATPVNSENDRVYSDARKKRQIPAIRLVGLRQREHFNRSITVSVGVSLMRKNNVGPYM